jgi:hypothetical protein
VWAIGGAIGDDIVGKGGILGGVGGKGFWDFSCVGVVIRQEEKWGHHWPLEERSIVPPGVLIQSESSQLEEFFFIFIFITITIIIILFFFFGGPLW